MNGALFTRAWTKIRYYRKSLPLQSVLLRVLIDAMAKIGVRIEPYYLMLEGVHDQNLSLQEKEFAAYTLGLLEPRDMRMIAALPGRAVSEAELLGRLQEGQVCFGATYQGKIVAFTWCNFEECMFEADPLFTLHKNEAYLFDAYTVESFRGSGIAPYLRSQCYRELAKRGRDRGYSITVALNRPALRLKQKLHAQILELRILIGLLKRWRWHRTLKVMHPDWAGIAKERSAAPQLAAPRP